MRMDMIGEDVRRKEDVRLLTGQGQFADDLAFDRPAFAAFVRSPHPHARIAAIDASAAWMARGVLAVLTGDDIVAGGLSPIPHAIGSSTTGSDLGMRNRDGSERARTDHLPLPVDKARYVGEAIVMVVAETTDLAKDAAELVKIDWEELPGVVRSIDALAEGSPAIWEHVPGNLALDGAFGDSEAVEAAFAGATHVLEFSSWVQRVTGVHMEPRTSAAEFDPRSGRFTVHASGGQGVVMMRGQIAASLGVDPSLVRVVAPRDVGGNFGTRNRLSRIRPACPCSEARPTPGQAPGRTH
jgi:carbon-monoxide dehydrogenase large subunit